MQGLLLSCMGHLSWEGLERGNGCGEGGIEFVSEKNTEKQRVYLTFDNQNGIIQKGLTCFPVVA